MSEARMILLSHPTGNANVQQAALALTEAGLLEEFQTCVGWNPDAPFNRFLPLKMRQQLNRRALPKPLRDRTCLHPFRELARHFCERAGLSGLTRHEHGMFSVDGVYRALDQSVALRVRRAENLSAVYAYEDGAAATFTAAKERGMRCIYDLPIGYWRVAHTLYDEEKQREPEWASTLSGTKDSAQKLARKDRELSAADLVLVASSFTRQTLEKAKVNCPVELVIYGAPKSSAEAPAAPTRAGKLRVLFVGGLGQRKGLSYLLRAVEMLGDAVELTLLGRKTSEECAPLNLATQKHRWVPSLPHAEVLREMGQHDVLLFPSLFEGFGLVILEAMAQGVPVITTPHTAGPDVIRDGVDGFLVPIRSPEAIAQRLDQLAANRGLLADMKRAAWERARQFTWESYRANLAAAVRQTMRANPLVATNRAVPVV